MCDYAFDKQIDRSVVPALKVHPNIIGTASTDTFAASVADMDFVAPPPVIEALKTRLEHGIFGYETVSNRLLPALIDWLKSRYTWTVHKDEILRSPNILNTLSMAVNLFSREGDGVIVQPPVFFDFDDILRENHRKLVSNPLILKNGRYFIDFDDLENKAKDPHTRMLFLCNPHNPVGRVWLPDELKQLGDICFQNEVLVIADEIHADITFNGKRYTPFASLGDIYANNSISCISPAKSFNIASCCSAFTIIRDPLKLELFQSENSRLTVNKNNAFSNVAMEAAYTKAKTWLDAVIKYLEGNIELVRSQLEVIEGIELIEPEGTFLLWLDCRSLNMKPKELKQFFREKAKWIVNSGESFGPEGAGFIRVNIACPKARLEKALGRLQQAIASES